LRVFALRGHIFKNKEEYSLQSTSPVYHVTHGTKLPDVGCRL
jgi:hypothetical protein